MRGMLAVAAAVLAAVPAAAGAADDWSAVNELLSNVSMKVDGQLGPLVLPVEQQLFPGVRIEATVNATLSGPFQISGMSVGNMTVTTEMDGEDAAVAHLRMSGVKVGLFVEKVVMEINGRLVVIFPIALNMHVNGSLGVSVTAGINADLRFSSNGSLAETPPQKVEVPVCDAAGTHVELQCEGEWPSLPIPGSPVPICDLVDSLPITDIICGVLQDPSSLLPGFGLSPILANVSKLITDAYVKPPPPPPASATEAYLAGEEGLSALNGSSQLEAARFVLDSVYGVKGTPPNDDRLVINQVVEMSAPHGLEVPLGITIPLPPLGLDWLSDAAVTIDRVRLRAGPITDFDLLEVQGQYSTLNTVAMQWLAVDVYVNVSWVTGGSMHPGPGVPFTDALHLAVNLTDVNATARLLLALRPSALGPLPLGGFFGSGAASFLNCLLVPTAGLGLTQLDMAVGSAKMSLAGEFVQPPLGASGGANALLRDALAMLSELYGRPLLKALPTLSQTLIGPLLNNMLNGTVSGEHKCDVDLQRSSAAPPIVDFNENFFVSAVDLFANKLTGERPDSDTGINTIVRKVAEASGAADGLFSWNTTTGGVIVDSPIPATPQNLDVGVVSAWYGNVSLRVGEFDAVRLLAPVAQCNGKNTGSCHTLETEVAGRRKAPISVAADVHLKVDGKAGHLDDWMRVNISMDALGLLLDVKALMESERFARLTVSDVTTSGCLLSVMAQGGFGIPLSTSTLSTMELGIDCQSDFHKCSGSALVPWSEGLRSAAGIETLTRLFNASLRQLTSSLEAEKTQRALEGLADGAVCSPPPPPGPPEDRSEVDEHIALIVYVLIPNAALLLLLTVISVHGFRSARVRPDEERPVAAAAEKNRADDSDSDDGEVHWFVRQGWHESLYYHPAVPTLGQVAVPLLLLATAGVLLSAHFAPYMIRIAVSLTAGGDVLDVDVFDYSTFNVLKSTWGQSSMIVMALLIGLLTGAYPYAKIMLLLWAWFCPTCVMGHEWRLHVLETLDYLCKWSLLDVLLSGTLVVIMHTPIAFPDSWEAGGAWVPGLFATKVYGTIGWGCWGLLLAQTINLLVGHYMVVQQRGLIATLRLQERVIGQAGVGPASVGSRGGQSLRQSMRSMASMASTTWFAHGAESTFREPLRGHAFKTGCIHTLLSPMFRATGRRRVQINVFGRVVVACVLLSCVGLIIAGSVVKSVGTQYKGLSRDLFSVTVEDVADREWNLFELVWDYVDEAGPDSAASLLMVLWVCVVFVIPIIASSALMLMWVFPFTLVGHKRLLFFCECLVSWSLIDVFVVVAGIVNLAADLLESFTMGNKSDLVNNFLRQLQELGLYDGPAEALHLDGWPRPGVCA
eukprot:TRINITY_DN4178_c2_g1_i2.p1 TRINITY_DN4178_c2_g1~~TRINITY_DN4178_c2_g1_i2.p1  ORF type:complete len:1359 (+),score=473.64 TRINITY_DN4178_c2_g1_i2:304-4380(+)